MKRKQNRKRNYKCPSIKMYLTRKLRQPQMVTTIDKTNTHYYFMKIYLSMKSIHLRLGFYVAVVLFILAVVLLCFCFFHLCLPVATRIFLIYSRWLILATLALIVYCAFCGLFEGVNKHVFFYLSSAKCHIAISLCFTFFSDFKSSLKSSMKYK